MAKKKQEFVKQDEQLQEVNEALTGAGKWIEENADLIEEVEIFDKIHKSLKHFGFILRYPKDKEHITGYPYEPWHIRYIGEDHASKIGNLTLEEYLKSIK